MDISLIVFYSIDILAIGVVSVVAYALAARYRWTLPQKLLYALISASVYLFFAQYLKYKSLHIYVDFSHWLQLLHTIVTTGRPEALNQAFIVPGTLNYLSVHFVPLIYVFAFFFRLASRPETLLFLNVAFMLSAAIPLYKLAVFVNGSKRFALLLAVVFLWYPTFQYITLYEFEMLRFSIPILLWMLYFFETRRVVPYLFFVVLAIFVREEVGLTVAMFGLYAWIFQKRWREGFVAIMLGLSGFFLITSVVMPALRSGEYTHVAAGVFSQFGSTPLKILGGVITQPFLVAQTVFNTIKFANIFMLFLPLLFVPLFTPTALIGALANIGIGFVSDSLVHSSYMLYYVAPSVPFIFYAFLKAWPRFISLSFWERGGVRAEGAIMHALLAGIIVSNIFFGPSPISLQFWFRTIQPAPFRTQDFHWSVYRVTNHHRKVEEFVRMIPDEAIVSAPQFLHPRLYKKRGTMIFPNLESKDKKWKADYVLLNTTNNDLKSESPAFISAESMAMVMASEEWQQVAAENGYALYRRRL